MRTFAAALLLSLAPAAFAAEDGGQTVFQDIVVKPGDTLSTISQAYLKDPTRWDEILKHNKMPARDPFVALPGMVIRVPVRLIKENLRAAKLVYRLNEVLFRKKETAAWSPAASNMELFRGDWLRTGKESKARVQFLTEDLLVLDASSMVELKPKNKNSDVELRGGGAYFGGGNSKVATPSLLITPKTKDTKYSVQVNERLDTRVKVIEGQTTVEAEGRKVDVNADQGIEVKLGEAPGVPIPADSLPDFPGRSADFADAIASLKGKSKMKVSLPPASAAPAVGAATGLGALKKELDRVSVGEPVSGYRLQAASDRAFTRMAVNRVFEVGAKMDLSRSLASGRYWVRFIPIDLLGGEGKPSAPKLYDFNPRSGFTPASGGAAPEAAAADPSRLVSLSRPAADETVASSSYRATGKVRGDDLSVTINGVTARVDEAGNFSGNVTLRPGANQIKIVVTDSAGATATVVRTVTYKP
ncbi:MAG: LysM peptidoglycan-binding domain-containing protein [Elusimicrobia bacterium]|nr:LysM peptidoglycan-binding domain-containing protein [Elusimicrobiota bacterium]